MYQSKNIEEIKKILRTSENGLKEEEVRKRLQENGKNEIPKPPKQTVFKHSVFSL